MIHAHGFIYTLFAQFLFFLFTIGLILWIIRSSDKKNQPDDPRKILDRRLASGEISEKEHASLVKKLKT